MGQSVAVVGVRPDPCSAGALHLTGLLFVAARYNNPLVLFPLGLVAELWLTWEAIAAGPSHAKPLGAVIVPFHLYKFLLWVSPHGLEGRNMHMPWFKSATQLLPTSVTRADVCARLCLCLHEHFHCQGPAHFCQKREHN